MEYTIPSYNTERFLSFVSRLQGRATKNGLSLSCDNVGEYALPATSKTRKGEVDRWTTFDVSLAAIKIGGYDLVGTIDHVSAGSALVNNVPGFEVPAEYRNSKGHCDHCDTIRNRKMTCILRDAEGNHISVGRSCVRDFIGVDYSGMFKVLESCAELTRTCEGEYEGDYAGGSYSQDFSLVDWLVASFAVVRVEGYHNSKAEISTSYKVRTIFIRPTFSNPNAHANHEAWLKSVEPTDADRLDANAAIEFIKNANEDSNYFSNLQAICKGNFVTFKTMGYATSIVTYYQRAIQDIEYKAKQAEQAATLSPAPTGKGILVVGEILSAKIKSSQYGDAAKILVLADDGFKTWGTLPTKLWDEIGDLANAKGKRITFKATITQSDDDATFSFYSRPSKASFVA